MPPFIAAQNEHASVTKQLIEARCNVDFQEKDGATFVIDLFLLFRGAALLAPALASRMCMGPRL